VIEVIANKTSLYYIIRITRVARYDDWGSNSAALRN
jgi:hypothetical protein